METTLRAATLDDLPRLTDIYNHYVIETPTTFDTTPFSVNQRRVWFNKYGETGRHRLIVAECDGALAGYTASSPFSDRAAYDTTVETTILCAPELVGRGIGRLLYARLFEELATEDVHSAIARVTLPNRGSHEIHLHFGFREMGVMREAGWKFGQCWDVGLYQKMMHGELQTMVTAGRPGNSRSGGHGAEIRGQRLAQGRGLEVDRRLQV